MSKERIFLAEHDDKLRGELASSLESLGFLLAGNSDRSHVALQQVEETQPDLVLVEPHPGNREGWLDIARQIHDVFEIPVVFITGEGEAHADQPRLAEQGYGFLARPFTINELKQSLEFTLQFHELSRQLRIKERRYGLIVEAANDGIWDWNLRTNEIYFSPRWKSMLGYGDKDIGTDPGEWFRLVHPDDEKHLQSSLVSHLKGITPSFESEYRIRHANGDYLWVVGRGQAIRDTKAIAYRMAGSQTDITARKMTEARLAHDAVHDALTGLPNRLLFQDRLQNRLERTRRNPADQFAVMFMDLDDMKAVNDSLGHAYGDQLLIAVSQRMRKCLRPEDTVARLSGDEFGILLNEVSDVSDTRRVADRIKAQLTATALLGDVERSITCSVGIVMFDRSYTSAEELMRDADSAMYYAKARGGNQNRVFDSSIHSSAVEMIQLEAELRLAVERVEWMVEYQPILSIGSSEILGYEALVRWRHPTRGILLPQEFLQLAEDTGLILPIGEYVLNTACSQVKAWRDAGRPNLWVSVNLSPRQFQDQQLVEKMNLVLIRSGVPGDALRLEITETLAIRDINTTIRLMQELGKLGISVLLDDFGTGYSSLSYLKQFPIQCLKIEKSFIQDIGHNPKNESLVTAIITIARALSLKVIAEGVEKEEQLSFLRAQMCDYAQGYLLGRPKAG